MTDRLLAPLRNVDQPSVLFCGAGLSVGSVPDAAKLYEKKWKSVEDQLGIVDGDIDHDSINAIPEKASRLYVWAERVLALLELRGVPVPKLRFAEALGLLDDPRWWGRAEIDFRGTTPRHRVIARFAKEGLWKSIWSFNWDCILENAMEQIGLSNGVPRFRQPWQKSHYVSHVQKDYFPCSTHISALNVHKPHGCVRALDLAKNAQRENDIPKAVALSSRLMVSDQELRDRSACPYSRENDPAFFEALRNDVRGAFNMVLGWSMREESLRKQLMSPLAEPGTRLVILDIAFGESHSNVCREAGLKQADVHFELKTTIAFPNRDDVFRWQQAIYTLDRLEAANDGRPILDRLGIDWRATLDHHPQEFLLDWADEFLPTWTKLCWSAGLVEAPQMMPHRVDLERRDEYIPLNYVHVHRPDLSAAARVLRALSSHSDAFNARDFPGGLFHHSGTLIVPLPSWGVLNELRALRPMVDALRGRLGYVAEIAVWPIHLDIASSHEQNHALLQSIAAMMPVPAFADLSANPGRIRLIANLNEVEL